METIQIILDLLNNRGITQSTLCKKTGISTGLFSDWKSGRSKPKMDKIQKIANYFGVSTDYLLTGKKEDTVKVYDEDDNIVVLDDETRAMIDSLRKRPEMKMLFSVSEKATKEDIIQAVKIIEALKGNQESD